MVVMARALGGALGAEINAATLSVKGLALGAVAMAVVIVVQVLVEMIV